MKGSGEETSILTLLLLPCHRDKRTSVSKPTKAVHSKDGYFTTWKWKDPCVPNLYLMWYICPETSNHKSDVSVESRGTEEIRHYKNHQLIKKVKFIMLFPFFIGIYSSTEALRGKWEKKMFVRLIFLHVSWCNITGGCCCFFVFETPKEPRWNFFSFKAQVFFVVIPISATRGRRSPLPNYPSIHVFFQVSFK